ncbi:MAG: PspC domain-containing protein [Chitinophagaceae bacterium]|nr:MAG: PspC domain-containing protein [Chitinophagaceae bacterium]
MKKIININLSGRVIPIEDAAYESLQRYIESLRRYFAAEEGRDEIINDIESRIAELMHDKVKKGAAAVTEADMESIINTMGRLEDFEEVDGDSGTASAAGASAGTTDSAFTRVTGVKPRGRLYRDTNDKILGGVCSGIAHYFGIDPAIVRIILAILVFGAGTGIFLYLLLWVFVPKRPLEPTISKRFFRNPEDRIIGGVCGGLAAYFNKDAWTFRLIFLAPVLLNILLEVLSAIFNGFGHHFFPGFVFGSFTGTFFIGYVVLWIILPEARSNFEKMEMRGENVDVHKIRENVKSEIESLKGHTQQFANEVKDQARAFGRSASEFAGTRGRTFASEVGATSRTVVHRTGSVIGTIVKAFVIFVVGSIAFAFFAVVIALMFTGVGDIANNFFLENGLQKFLGWAGLLLFFGVPFMALVTWLTRRIMKVRSQSHYLGWIFGSLWVIGILCVGLFAGSMFKSFRFSRQAESNVVPAAALNHLNVTVSEPEIRYSGYYSFINMDGDNGGWDVNEDSMFLSNVHLVINKSNDDQYHVKMTRGASGMDARRAEQRAGAIQYPVFLQDSTLNLGSGFAISRNDKFRNQEVYVEIQVPVGKSIRFDQSINERLHPVRFNSRYNNRRRYDRDFDDFNWENEVALNEHIQAGVRYVMDASGDLVDPVGPRYNTSDTTAIDGQGRYEYRRGTSDSLQRSIDEKERQLERERRDLEELRNREQEKRDQDERERNRRPEPEARQTYAPMPNATESLII